MRVRPCLRASLLIAAVACAPAAGAEATRTLRLEYSPKPGARFAVENLAGAMRVRPGSGADVAAVATVHAESGELAQSVRFEQVRGDEGVPTLRVIYPLDRHDSIRYPGHGGETARGRASGGSQTTTRYDGRKVKVSASQGVLLYADVEVLLPPRSLEARFRNVAGPLSGEQVSGHLIFDTDTGEVTLARLRGDIVADTGSGDVKISGVEGSVSCDTGSGDCDLSDVRAARVSCDTGSGNVALRSIRASGEIRADTGSGNVRASELEGSFTCDTGSGDCEVDGLRGGRVECDTGSGDCRLRSIVADRISADTGSGDVVAEGVDVEAFEADTGSGEVRLESRGARLSSITADTGSGSVVLRLGPDASFHAVADQGSGDLVNRYADAQPIIEDRRVIGYRRGDGRIRISVDTGSGALILEPGEAAADARRPRPAPR